MRHRPDIEPIDPATFRTIAGLAYRESGLTFVREKASMVQLRLRHRLQAVGVADFEEYASLLASENGGSELRQFISALTTNVSHFFRERHHFEALNDLVAHRLPALRKGASLRIWSAGCSNGQEPLSAAIGLIDSFPELATLDLRILATDIDPKVIAFAKAGLYPGRMLQGLSPPQRAQHFCAVTGSTNEPLLQAGHSLMSVVHYKELNLFGDWPMRAQFDAVFCRNTVIYFDSAGQSSLWPRFHQILKPQGKLFLGHSERIPTPEQHSFACDGTTTYRQVSH